MQLQHGKARLGARFSHTGSSSRLHGDRTVDHLHVGHGQATLSIPWRFVLHEGVLPLVANKGARDYLSTEAKQLLQLVSVDYRIQIANYESAIQYRMVCWKHNSSSVSLGSQYGGLWEHAGRLSCK